MLWEEDETLCMFTTNRGEGDGTGRQTSDPAVPLTEANSRTTSS